MVIKYWKYFSPVMFAPFFQLLPKFVSIGLWAAEKLLIISCFQSDECILVENPLQRSFPERAFVSSTPKRTLFRAILQHHQGRLCLHAVCVLRTFRPIIYVPIHGRNTECLHVGLLWWWAGALPMTFWRSRSDQAAGQKAYCWDGCPNSSANRFTCWNWLLTFP